MYSIMIQQHVFIATSYAIQTILTQSAHYANTDNSLKWVGFNQSATQTEQFPGADPVLGHLIKNCFGHLTSQ